MRIVVFGAIVIASILVAYFMTTESQNKKQLRVIQPNEIIEPGMVPNDLKHVSMGHRIGDFSFQNQYNETVSLADVKGKVFVVEYFFTTCGTICPRMTQQMMRVQEKFKGVEDVKILSFTVNPEIDTVEVMKEYADGHGAVKDQWHFLTGEKEKLYDLARRSFFVLKPAEAQNLGDAGSDFIHTNNFVLVDQELRIRNYYDGTSMTEVSELMEDIQLLLDEEK